MKFKIRASGVSQIMTNSRSKSEPLGETCKTFLEDWYKEQIYGFRKEIKSKYLTKGLMMEDTAIEFYSVAKDIDFMIKNIDHYSDDFMQGTPDLIHHEIVYDFKISWNAYTFPLFDSEYSKPYWMQLQVYMHLTGVKKARLVYILQDTPDFLTYEEPISYDALDLKYRIKEFEFDYDPEFIETVKERVLLCRDYLQKLAI
jgi:hypothetical protein